jgi:hypothetical protein
MIPNHAQFLAALADRKKISVRFYSKADNGVLEHICAPMSYGSGSESKDGLNRYHLWDYASVTDKHTLELLPSQIVAVSVLGKDFDVSDFTSQPTAVTSTQEP